MRNHLAFIARRLREPSSAAGLGVLVALFGAPAGMSELIVQVLAGVAAAVAVLLPEAGA